MRSSFFCLLIFFSQALFSQEVYENYSPANGLVDARVNNIVQDKYGRLIFLSREGFSIFDGQRFSNYFSVDNVQVGITDAYIFLPDSSLYIIPFTGGGIRIEKNKVSFDSSFLNGLTEISSVKKLSNNDYLVISNYGLYRYKDKKLSQLTNKSTAYPFNLNHAVNCASIGHSVILAQQYDSKSYRVFLYDIDRGEVLDNVKTGGLNRILDDGNNLILHFNDGIRQIDTLWMKKGKLRFNNAWFMQYLPADFLTEDIAVDRAGNAWCSNRRLGVYKVSPTTGKKRFYAGGHGLETSINAVFVDSENNTWFMNPGKGVQKMLQSRYEKISGIEGYDLSSNILLYNIAGAGLYIESLSGCYLLKGDSISKAGEYKRNSVFPIFYWNQELWHFGDHKTVTGQSGKKTTIQFTDSTDGLMQFSPKIATDRNDNLLISGNCLYVFAKDGKAAAVQLPYFADKIAVDDENNYWAFCRGGLLAKYRYEDGRILKKSFQKISIQSIRCATYWSKDIFLIGTRNEGLLLVKVGPAGASIIQQFTRSKGLSNNFILDVIKLDSARIAVGTASGLDIISMGKADTSIQKLSLAINNYEPMSVLDTDGDGRIFSISESTGNLFVYNAGKFNSIRYFPHAYISSITVNGKPAESEHSFNYRQNDFLFQIAAPSFIDNRNINFYFSLEAGNGEQSQVNNNGTYLLNNLEPGDYHLKIKIVYPGNIYPDELLEYRFSVKQPFWKTWWFIGLCFFAATLSLVFLVRSFYRRKLEKERILLERQQAIEKERTRIATDMHDDFGANLSRIKFLSEKMQVKNRGDDTLQTDLNKISTYSDEMAEKMGEIVWALNQRYDSLEDLVSFSRAWASEYLQDKDIRFQFIAYDYADRKIQGEVRRNIFLIIKEALHNVVKHSGATVVTINFEYREQLHVTIHDNGKGIDVSTMRPFANGVENMKKRMESVGGSFSIRKDEGTLIDISAPI